MEFARFMASPVGRIVRIIAGVAFIRAPFWGKNAQRSAPH